MKFKNLISILFILLTAQKLFSQPQPVSTADRIFNHGTTYASFNFTDAFCPDYPCSSPVTSQVVVAGDMYSDSYLYWYYGKNNTGRILISRQDARDGFKITDMLVGYNGSTPVCYIVGAYHANSDPTFFGRAKILTAYWDGSAFVWSGPAQNITTASFNTWDPKIAQDFLGNLIIAWWQSGGNSGNLMAKKYTISSSSPFYTGVGSVTNIYNYISGTSGYTFYDEADVALHQPDYPIGTDPIVSFTLKLTDASSAVIKVYQTVYSNLTSGTTTDIVSVNSSQYSISPPSIGTTVYDETSCLYDYCLTYSLRDASTNVTDIISQVKYNGALLTPRFLNHDYNEQYCASLDPKVSGGQAAYVVTWGYNDCNNLISGSNGLTLILGRYMYMDGNDFNWAYIPYYFIVNNDFTYAKYSPSVSLNHRNAWDNIYVSYLYNDGPDIILPGTVINYYIGYKYLGGWAYKNRAVPVAELFSPVKNVLNVFPNPAGDMITVQSSAALRSIRITDVAGKNYYVQNDLSGGSTTQVDLSRLHLGTGIYFLIAIDNTGRQTSQKFFKK